MSEMATAYVQIVPSAQGIHGSISSVLAPEAESAGTQAGSTVGEGIGTALKGAILASTAAATAAAISLGKSVVSAFGDFEQLTGGVETLFGTGGQSLEEYAAKTGSSVQEIRGEYGKLLQAEETVLANADAAYKTAGLSANEYMETVTSFSAAMISSLDGDTKTAADKANQAIIDMSDNANKMGSDIGSIQNAYQGFAKQNYTMLDNLKLGYGGTKTEMERLLADAEKFSGIKYDISSYADVVDAIHVIQTEMGITGTTAKEAESTIQGSINMTKSAWENFIVALGTGEGVEEALKNVTDSFSSVLGNIQPVIERLITTLPTALNALLPVVQSMLPTILLTVTNLFTQVLTGIINAIPMLTGVIVQIVQSIATTLIENAPTLITGAIELITQLGAGLISMIPMLVDSVIQIVQGLLQYIMENGMVLLEGGLALLQNLAMGIVNNLPQLIETVTTLINTFLNYILTHLPEILQMGMNILMQIATGIIQNLPQIILAVAQMIITFLTTIVEHLPEILQKGIEIIAQLVVGIVQAIPQVVEGILQVVEGIKNTLVEKWEDFKEAGINIVKGIAEGIKNGAIAVWDAITDVCQKAWDKVTDFFDIGSPSKLMDWGGHMVDLGFAGGIKDYGKKVITEAQKVGTGVYDAMTSPISANMSASRTATINLNVVGEVNGKQVLALVNNGLGVQL